ncbi:Nitrogen permease regulator 3-like protein, partial [Operophtera brumata]
YTKFDKFHEDDSANHSFDDGIDVVDGIKTNGGNVNSESQNSDTKKPHANSVDSGISNINNGVSENVTQHLNSEQDVKVKSLQSRLSDLSLKESEHSSNKDTSDDDKFESDQDVSPQIKTNGMPPTVWNVPASCDVVDACRFPTEPPSTESLLDTFSRDERAALANIPAADNPDDLLLLAQLHKKDKFRDVLITFETEDPAVAMLYPYQ